MEVTFILNIRERNDCAKDKQSKYRVASTGQHQMVQKFVKELNDSTKQSEQPSNAERTATEQVETTAREIVHEAVQLPRRAIQHTARRESADSSANSQPEQSDQPRHAPESPRERPAAPRTQPDATPPQSTPTPAPQEQARRAYVQQTAKSVTPAPPITSEQPRPQHTTVTAPSVENTPRQRTDDVRTRPEPQRSQSAPPPAPQEQARSAYVQQTAKTATPAPPITSEQPQHTTVTVAPAENAPRQRMVDIRTLSEPQRPQNVSPPVPRVYIQQTAKASTTTKAPERSTIPDTTPIEKQPRQRMEDVRIRPELTQQHKPEFQPQEQGRRAYVKRAKKSRTEKSSARDHLHTEQPEIRLADDMPQNASPPIREKPTFTELRSEPPPEPTPENASNVQHIKQTGTWTPRGTELYSRGKAQPIRERSAVTLAHDLPPTPQEQARQAFVEKQAQLSQSPSIHRIHLSIRTGCPYSAAAACFGSTRNYAGASAGHGWQQQTGPTCPATNTSTHPTSGAAARHPRKAEAKRRAEGTAPARRRYSDKGNSANQRTKGSVESVCTKNCYRARTKSSNAGRTAENAPKEQQPGYQSSRRSREKAGRSCGKGGQGADKRPRQFGWRHGAFCRVFHRHCCGDVFGFSVGDSLC